MDRYKQITCEHCGNKELTYYIETYPHSEGLYKDRFCELIYERYLTIGCPKCGKIIKEKEDISLNGAIMFEIDKMDHKSVTLDLHKDILVDYIVTPDKTTYMKIKPRYKVGVDFADIGLKDESVDYKTKYKKSEKCRKALQRIINGKNNIILELEDQIKKLKGDLNHADAVIRRMAKGE